MIVTGSQTGAAVDDGELRRVRNVVDVPVIVGSGVNVDTVGALSSESDGLIIGSATKERGDARWPVDPERAAAVIGGLAFG